MFSIRIAAFLFAVLLPAAVQAGPMRYSFSGKIEDVRDYTGVSGVAAYIPLGTTFSGTFVYDPDAPLLYNITPDRGVFGAPSQPVSTTVGNYVFDRGGNQLQLINGNPGLYFLSSDQFDFSGLPPSMRGYEIVTRIQLYGNVSGLTLPPTLDLTNFPGFMGITGYSTAGTAPSYFAWHVAGNISSLTELPAVPEPTTWAMLLVGFGLLGRALRRQSRFNSFVRVASAA